MKLYKKIIIICGFAALIMSVAQVFANPEMSGHGPTHFVLDKNNADHEYKPPAAQCKGGPVPNGDGTAWGKVCCAAIFDRLPWYNVPGLQNAHDVSITSDDMQGTDCEMFDVSNNAGNNQGYSVTQYNSQNWRATYKAQMIGSASNPVQYRVQFCQVCDDGAAQ